MANIKLNKYLINSLLENFLIVRLIDGLTATSCTPIFRLFVQHSRKQSKTLAKSHLSIKAL